MTHRRARSWLTLPHFDFTSLRRVSLALNPILYLYIALFKCSISLSIVASTVAVLSQNNDQPKKTTNVLTANERLCHQAPSQNECHHSTLIKNLEVRTTNSFTSRSMWTFITATQQTSHATRQRIYDRSATRNGINLIPYFCFSRAARCLYRDLTIP
jgi:hypothetical protein